MNSQMTWLSPLQGIIRLIMGGTWWFPLVFPAKNEELIFSVGVMKTSWKNNEAGFDGVTKTKYKDVGFGGEQKSLNTMDLYENVHLEDHYMIDL
ncbi:hypothetical protein Tco_0475550 [Tanacetum coccineum]